jgi:hypothetical protein
MQEYINIVGVLLISVVGWYLRNMQDKAEKLAEKVAAIEVLVAGHYVRRDELTGFMIRIEHKLDAVSNKLDTKADKP